MPSRSAFRSGRSFFRSSSSRSRQRVSSRPYARFEPLEDRNLLAASVLTDKSDYLFGETALISGAGFTADETVQLQVLHAPGTVGSNADAQNQPWLVLADTSGGVASQWSVTDPDAVDATYVLIATGLTSGFVAEASFTDSGPPSNGNLFQWDPPGWVTGNNDGPYFEGDTVPYYTNFSNLVVGDTYSITIEWDTTKSGKHAIDYLRSYDTTIAFPPAIDPAVEAGVNVMSTDTIPIPTDTFMTTHPTFSGVQQPGSFKMYNGDMTAVSAYNNPLTYLGDTSTNITVTFVAQDDDGDINTTTTSVVLTWGGHIATRQDWGLLNSAVNIPGSPYHMRLDSFFDVTNDEELGLGNTDRSLSAQAVIFPALITIIKDAVPDDAQVFAFTTTGTGLSNFSLDDDGDNNNALSNTRQFSVTTFDQKSVTEAIVPGWELTNIQISEIGGTNDSTFNVGNRLATLNVQEGEVITVRFTNEIRRGGITVIKNAIPDGPQDFSFSGTLPVFSLDDDADPTLSNTALFSNLTPGSYTITEAQVVGWDLTNLQFVGDTDNGSLVNLATRTITVDVDPGENITVTFTNTQRGGITVIKNAIPDGPQDFSFSGTLPVFSLDDDADPTLSNTALFSNLTPGSYTITEAQVVGWDLTNLQFVGDTDNGSLVNLATRTITVDVDPGENITVTFTNTQRGGITVIKNAIPDGPQDFSFSGTLPVFSLDDDADPTLSNTALFSNLTPGSYTITEAQVVGWDLTNLQFVGDTDNGSLVNLATRTITVDVDPGENITVTFTNTQRGGITVIKNAIPDGPQDFSFSGTLPVFSLDDDADPTLSNTALFSNLTPGSYTITEAQVVGWDLTNLQFVGDTDNGSLVNLATRTITVDVDPGENITVTFTNTQRGGITVIKNAIPDGPQDFSFSGTLPVFSLDDDADPTLSNTALFSNLTPGSYTITEAQVVGWDLTNLQFVGDTDNGSLVNLATRTITVDVDPGENITVTFTNTQRGGITVIKNAIPDGPQDFSFSGTLPVFSLDDDADPTLSNTALFSNLTPGSYTITEAQVVGWDLTNLQFVGDTDNGSLVNLATRTITVDVDPGENITVTFTNTQRGGITVIKNAIPDGPQDFSFSGTLPVFSLDDDADPTLSNTALFSNLTPGSYTITEAQVVGWDLTNLQFVGDTDNGSLVNLATRTITVDVDPGENITVTFTNTQRGGITVIKNAIPDGPQDFSFSGTLPVFSLDDDADPTLSNTALFSNLTPGSYTITEAQVVGWDLTNLQFVGDTDNGSLVNLATRTITVDVDPGENITVTFTNTQRGGITVIKNAIPDGPQDFSFSGTLPVFSLDDDADPTLSNTALFSNLTPGSYTITEAQVVGWDLTNLQFVGDTDNGSLVNLATRTITVDVDPGENITVTFTNTQRGGITVIKNAIPDGPQDFSFSGTLPVFSLDDDADPTLSNTALFSNLTPGSYTITEAQVVGWDLTNLQFVGDTDNGSLVNLATRTITVDVDPGENITVTFTNTQRGGITVIKNAIPDGPQDFSFSGTLPVFSLDDDADPTLSNTALFSNLTPGSYTITEAQVVGWDLTNLQFVGDTDNGSLVNLATRTITVDVDPGENITVTFTNTQRGGITVIKNAIPDGPQDFSFSGTLPVFSLDDDADPTLSNTALFSNLTPGSYTITEAQVVGWDLTNLQFVGDTDNGSLVNLATRTITVDVDPGENITVTFTNTQRGGITVIKNAIPDGPQDFSFSGTLPVFSLDDDADPTLSNTALFSNLTPGSYTITEAQVVGWDLTNLQFVGDTDNGSLVNLATRTITVDVDPGENITVTFTNTQRGGITVIKNAIPDGPQDFSFSGTLPVFSLDDDADPTLSNTRVFSNLLPGSYVLTEAVVAGWNLANIVIQGDTDNGSIVNIPNRTLTIDVDPGEAIQVTFVNVQEPPIVVAPDKSLGSQPVIEILNSVTGALINTFLAYEASYIGGVRIATGDLTGDGIAEIVTAPGRNHVPVVRVFSQNGTMLTEFLAFDSGFLGGVDVAVGDVDGDGKNDIIAGQSFDGSAVRVFRNVSNPLLAFQQYKSEFYPFGAAFRGGVVVAAADMGTFANGTVVNAGLLDGIAEVVVGNEAGLRSTVSVLDYTGPLAAQVRSLLPLANDFRGGVSMEIARVNGDLVPDIIVGAGNRGDSIVEVRDGLTGALITTFAAFTAAVTPSFQAPTHLASLDLDGNGIADSIVVVQGSDGASRLIRFFNPLTGQLQRSLVESDPRLAGAYFVAALNNAQLPQVIPVAEEPGVGVTSVIVVNGNLVIEGDGGNDVVTITGTGVGGQYVVVTAQGSQTVSGVLGSMLINLHGGDDQLTINKALVAGKISIAMEAGEDAVVLGNNTMVSSAGNLEVDLGAGSDSLTAQRTYIGAAQLFVGGDGDDQLVLAGSYTGGVFVLGISSAGATSVGGGAGNDTVDVRYSFIVGHWSFDGGQGNDAIGINTSACTGNVVVAGGTDNDALVVDTNFFTSGVTINGNAGSDQMKLANSLGIQLAVLLGEDGADTANVQNLTAKNLQLNLGTGADDADVRSNSLDLLFAQLGDGDDELTVFGNLVNGAVDLDGGLGSLDRLFDLGNSFKSTVGKKAFELFA